MEISGLPPYLAAQVSNDPENLVANGQDAAKTPKAAPAQEAAAKDRVELVRSQNLVSPPPEDTDLKKAAILLRQVSHQLKTMERQDMRQLYQFDRLRDLCCRLQGSAEA